MFTPLRFESEVEELVCFVEETDPQVMVEATLARLRNGTSAQQLLTASALAIVRSTELPPQHHGGPVHPICAVRAVAQTSKRLAGEVSYLPLIQHAALCNNHVHSPQMGPYLMPAIKPLAGTAQALGSYHISDETFHGEAPVQADASADLDPVSATKDAFHRSVLARQTPAAEHHFLWLLEELGTPQERSINSAGSGRQCCFAPRCAFRHANRAVCGCARKWNSRTSRRWWTSMDCSNETFLRTVRRLNRRKLPRSASSLGLRVITMKTSSRWRAPWPTAYRSKVPARPCPLARHSLT